MKKLITFIKTESLLIVSIPIVLNFIFNFVENKEYRNLLNGQNDIKIISLFLGSLFIYSLTNTIKKTFNLNSNSLTITYFFLSFFLLDSIFLPITRFLSFDLLVHILLLFWLLIIIYFNKSIYTIIQPTFSFFLWRWFNSLFIDEISDLSNYQELNTDVPIQWYGITKMIYENNYFFALENNLIEGQGLLPSYIHSLFLKIGFDIEAFMFIQTASNLLLFMGILLISDLRISKNNKIVLSILFIVLILNNEWLSYLLINSLMIEGVVSFLIAVFLINFSEHFKSENTHSAIFFLFFGSMVLTKNFISILSLFVIVLGLLKIKKNKKIAFGIIIYSLHLIYQKIFFSKLQSFAYTNEINFKELLFDLLLFRNLELKNIFNILSQIFIDKPLSYIFFIFLFSNIIQIIRYKNYKFEEVLLFVFIIFNYLLVNLLYISYWQNIEYESSYRYIVNTFHLILISTGIQLSNFKKNI